MPGRVLALFAKLPAPGSVKTRLVPAVSEEQAADLYRAMLLDILDQHRNSAARLALWHTPPEAADWFRRHVPATYRLYAQRGPDLGARMAHLFETHTREGSDRIVLRGTDSPTLPVERVGQAFERLEEADLVLCPDRDGGYNLIGLRCARRDLFDLRMSTASVLEQTLSLARAAGLRVALLPEHYDVDTPEDLELLVTDVTVGSTPRTRAWLRAAGCVAARTAR